MLHRKLKKKQELVRLSNEISEKTVSASSLPLYEAYEDKDGKHVVSGGVYTENSFLAPAWTTTPPSKLYIRPINTQESLKEVKNTFTSSEIGYPLVYQTGNDTPLVIPQLSDIGTYELQAVTFSSPQSVGSPKIELADYHDGNIVLTKDKIDTINRQLQGNENLENVKKSGIAILLFKSDSGYLPVALYDRTKNHAIFLEDVNGLKTRALEGKEEAKVQNKGKSEQLYYVLQNDYQQLVFTNVGGALAEINLPFSSDSDRQSPVRSIEFDRDIAEKYSYNAHFPAHPYLTPGKSGSEEYVKNPIGEIGGYYPLIRRDLIETGNRQSVNINPRYYALNLLSEYPEFSELVYTVKQFDSQSITFEGQQRQRKITKTYSFPKDKNAPYVIDLTVKIEGDRRGLWISSGIPEVELFSGTPAPALKYRITRNQKPYVENISLPEEVTMNSSSNPDWICNSNGFFGIIVDPLTQVDSGFRALHVAGQTVPSRITEVDQSHELYNAKDYPGYMTMLPLSSSSSTTQYRIFAGPFSSAILKNVDNVFADDATGYNPDYIACQSYHGWFTFISEPFAKLLLIMMTFFHSITGSWAFSIVLLTAALRLMMYPLNAWSTRSMLKMQQIGPMVSAIQEKYKKDPKKMQTEVMNLYREQKVNPMSGCVPMLIQMPFLIGMFDLLKSTFELRGASFIPGWIDNLTAPDVLFSWNTPIPFIGTQFHLLPILLGVVMYFQQRHVNTVYGRS